MDCASCAAKIDTAVRRLDGVADVSVSVTGASMTVSHGGALPEDRCCSRWRGWATASSRPRRAQRRARCRQAHDPTAIHEGLAMMTAAMQAAPVPPISTAMPSRGRRGGAPPRGADAGLCGGAGRRLRRRPSVPGGRALGFPGGAAGRPGADRPARADGGAGRHAVLDRDADDDRGRRCGDHRRDRGSGRRGGAVPDRRTAGRRGRRPRARQHPGPCRPGAEDGAGGAGRRHASRLPAESLAVGDVIVVRPGDRIPADGEIVEGVERYRRGAGDRREHAEAQGRGGDASSPARSTPTACCGSG